MAFKQMTYNKPLALGLASTINVPLTSLWGFTWYGGKSRLVPPTTGPASTIKHPPDVTAEVPEVRRKIMVCPSCSESTPSIAAGMVRALSLSFGQVQRATTIRLSLSRSTARVHFARHPGTRNNVRWRRLTSGIGTVAQATCPTVYQIARPPDNTAYGRKVVRNGQSALGNPLVVLLQ